MPHPYPRAFERYPKLRQSLLASFDACALQAHFEMLYARGWDTHPQARGTITHRTLGRCLEEMHRQGERRIEPTVALAILHETLRQADVDTVCHEPGCDLPAEWLPVDKRREDGRPLTCSAGHRHFSSVVNIPMAEVKDLYWVVAKWAADNEFDTPHLIDIERRLDATVIYPDPSGGMVERVLTGQLDALFLDPVNDATAIVLDWKDTWALPPAAEVSFEGYFQQRWYAFLVLRNYPTINRVVLREFYVRYSQAREAVIDRDKLADIEAEFSALAERFDRAYENDNWRPTPGRHCGYCPRPTQCPIPVFVRGEGRITDADQAAKVAAQLTVAEVVVDQTKKAMKSYVDIHGPVRIKDAKGETFYGYQTSERTSRPSREQIEMAQAAGTPIGSLYKTSKGTRFGRYTLRPGEETEADMALLEAMRKSVEEPNRRSAA